jgi:hypothetical protein
MKGKLCAVSKVIVAAVENFGAKNGAFLAMQDDLRVKNAIFLA